MERGADLFSRLACRETKAFFAARGAEPVGVGSGDLSGGFLEFDFGDVAEGVEGRSEIRD